MCLIILLFLGERCELCGSRECLNGGTCARDISYPSASVSGAVCRCTTGWVGPNCSTSICKSFCANDVNIIVHLN